MSALLKNVFSDILHINKYKKLKMAYVYLLIFILFNYNQNFSLSFPKTVIISSSLLPITNGLFFNNFLLPKNFQCTHDSWYARRISSIIFLSCLHIMLTLYSNNKKPTSQPTRLAILYVAVQLILYFVLNDNDNINNSYKTLLCLITWFFYLAIIHFTDEKKYTQEKEIYSRNGKLNKYCLKKF